MLRILLILMVFASQGWAQNNRQGPSLKCLRMEGQKLLECGAPAPKFCNETCDTAPPDCMAQINAAYVGCPSTCTICAQTQMASQCSGRKPIPPQSVVGSCTKNDDQTCGPPNYWFDCDGTWKCSEGTKEKECWDYPNSNTAANTSICDTFDKTLCDGSAGGKCPGTKQLDPFSCKDACKVWSSYQDSEDIPCTGNTAMSAIESGSVRAGVTRIGGGGGSTLSSSSPSSTGAGVATGGTRRRMETLTGPTGENTVAGANNGNTTSTTAPPPPRCTRSRICFREVSASGTPCCPSDPECPQSRCKCGNLGKPDGLGSDDCTSWSQ